MFILFNNENFCLSLRLFHARAFTNLLQSGWTFLQNSLWLNINAMPERQIKVPPLIGSRRCHEPLIGSYSHDCLQPSQMCNLISRCVGATIGASARIHLSWRIIYVPRALREVNIRDEWLRAQVLGEAGAGNQHMYNVYVVKADQNTRGWHVSHIHKRALKLNRYRFVLTQVFCNKGTVIFPCSAYIRQFISLIQGQ